MWEFGLLEQQAGAVGQWATQANVCAHVQFGRLGGFSGVQRLTSVPTSVWDAVSGVHRPKSLLPLVGSLGYISSFVICASVLPSFRVRLPILSSVVSIDARRDNTRRLM